MMFAFFGYPERVTAGRRCLHRCNKTEETFDMVVVDMIKGA